MTDLARDLNSLVPPFDDADADWQDALRRSGGHRRWPVALLAAALVAATLAAASFGTAIGGDTFDRLTAWVSGAPGDPASEEELNVLREANARSLAPLLADTELGLLGRQSLKGVNFELLGFRDRSSLCLRLRNPGGRDDRIVTTPAICVSEELLVNLAKPLAVFSAADPFPRRAQLGVQALYGLAADRIAFVEFTTEAGTKRVPVENNAFLLLYEGDGPRLSNSRLDYPSDVPSRAVGLDAQGRTVDSVPITSLKRGFPDAPKAAAMPGPEKIDREIAPRVGWIERGEARGASYRWPHEPPSNMDRARLFHPNPATSLRVLVGRATGESGPMQCLMAVSPLEADPRSMGCFQGGVLPGLIAFGVATPSFDLQFPVYYGLVPDEVHSLELILMNGARLRVPIVDNVFAQQAWNAQAAKLVGYDGEGRVVLVRVLAF